jgi:N-acetyl-anhydromuramyl-L-alanine amidase AmpD
MQQALNEVGQIAQRLSAVIWQVLQFIWNWSFGQVVRMFQMPFKQSAVVEASPLCSRHRGASLLSL